MFSRVLLTQIEKFFTFAHARTNLESKKIFRNPLEGGQEPPVCFLVHSFHSHILLASTTETGMSRQKEERLISTEWPSHGHASVREEDYRRSTFPGELSLHSWSLGSFISRFIPTRAEYNLVSSLAIRAARWDEVRRGVARPLSPYHRHTSCIHTNEYVLSRCHSRLRKWTTTMHHRSEEKRRGRAKGKEKWQIKRNWDVGGRGHLAATVSPFFIEAAAGPPINEGFHCNLYLPIRWLARPARKLTRHHRCHPATIISPSRFPRGRVLNADFFVYTERRVLLLVLRTNSAIVRLAKIIKLWHVFHSETCILQLRKECKLYHVAKKITEAQGGNARRLTKELQSPPSRRVGE